jgi:hypothetical protein
MKIDELKFEINRIASLEVPQEAYEEIKKLNERIQEPNVEVRITGNWAYFYVIEYRYDSARQEARGKTKGKLGKMEKEKYLENKKEIDNLPVKKLKEMLITY